MTSFTFFLFFIPVLTGLLLFVNLIFSPSKPYHEKTSTFECGYHSFIGQNRTQFNISFFLFGLLFLVFDLEIALLFPYIVSAYVNELYGLMFIMGFLLILTLGFLYELGKNALKINSKQTLSNNKLKIKRKNSFGFTQVQIRKFSNSRTHYQENKKRTFFNRITTKGIFNRKTKTLIKFLLVVLFGYLTRFAINYFFNINVFTDYNNIISLVYYFFFAFLLKAIHYLEKKE